MRFSQRIGRKPVRTLIQASGMDEALRNSLWNVVHILIYESNVAYNRTNNSENVILFRVIWSDFFKARLDALPYSYDRLWTHMHDWFHNADWAEVYDLIEFLAQCDVAMFDEVEFTNAMNAVLTREMSAYRLVNGHVVPVSNQHEADTINAALGAAAEAGLASVYEHLDTALACLADRANPDYRNAIKESISAVEAAARAVSGDPKATLGQALKRVDVVLPIHPSLKEGFSKLYGYTSDAGGIRHALTDDPKCGVAEARFMIVSCSAFIGYLIERANDAGIKLVNGRL